MLCSSGILKIMYDMHSRTEAGSRKGWSGAEETGMPISTVPERDAQVATAINDVTPGGKRWAE